MASRIYDVVGRENELEALLAMFDTPADPTARIVVIAGDPGIGKTTLWLAALAAAGERGWITLTSRPSEAEAPFSFAGLADLIGQVVGDTSPHLPPPQRRALQAALALTDADPASPTDEGIVAFAFLNLLRRLASTGKVVLAVDDLQWLDAPSSAILQYAIARLETEPIIAIFAARGEGPEWLRRNHASTIRTIQVGPLSVGALREVLRVRAGITLTRPMLMRVWEASGGNPFYALELARALNRRGGRVDPGEELPIPATLDELVAERLDGLDARAVAVVQIAAALASPTVGLVESAAGDDDAVGLERAVGAGVLETDGDAIRFSHPLLRSAVASRTDAIRRRAIHARLGALVRADEERARHRALAASGPHREVAAIVEEAAKNARLRGAMSSAAELADLAVHLTPAEDVADSQRRLLACADLFLSVGDPRRAIAMLERAHAAAEPGAARATISLHLALATAEVDGANEAAELCRRSLVDARGDDALKAEMLLALAELARKDQGGLRFAQEAMAVTARLDDPALRCKALATFGFLSFRAGRGVPYQEMEEALALERSLPGWPRDVHASMAAAHQLVWSGDLDRARTLLIGLRDVLRASERPQEEEVLWYLAIVDWRAGDWLAASRYAEQVLDVRRQFGVEGDQPIAEFPAALIAAHRGSTDEAREMSERAIARAQTAGVRELEVGHRAVLGFIEWSGGDAAAALPHLRLAWGLRDETWILEPGHRIELADTLEALIATGQLDEAEQRLVPWEERSHTLDRAWGLAITARCRALLDTARGDLEAAFDSFDRALSEHTRTQDPFQHARTLLALGATQRRAKQRGTARQTLSQALEIFERLGAPLWAARTRVEARRIGGRQPASGDLTEAERRIARLVAEGRTNREVATALFVTEHTVEAALTRVYRKLGVRSRAELAARLARES